MAACGLVRVRFGRTMGLFDRLDDVLTVDLTTYSQVTRAFQGIMEEQQNPGPGSEFIKAALMSQSLCYLFRHLATREESPMPWLAALESPQMAKAVDQILDNPAGQHTVESLAVAASLSRSAFAKRFHDAFGKPPMNFLHDIRMQRAARLLQVNSDVSMDEVALQVGFQSRSHFSRAFKKYYGMSPVEQRDQETVGMSEEAPQDSEVTQGSGTPQDSEVS
jgi:AraC-like DNA-binding protein